MHLRCIKTYRTINKNAFGIFIYSRLNKNAMFLSYPKSPIYKIKKYVVKIFYIYNFIKITTFKTLKKYNENINIISRNYPINKELFTLILFI